VQARPQASFVETKQRKTTKGKTKTLQQQAAAAVLLQAPVAPGSLPPRVLPLV